MKIVHWAAIAVLTLLTLMNLGTVTGDSSTAVIAVGIVLGIAGLVAIYGLVRRPSWGPLSALAIGVANLVGGIASRNAGTPRYGILLICILTLPFAAATTLSPVPFLPSGWWWFAAKVLFVVFLFLLVRATFPRYRYDQLMRLGWKVFLPLSLLWVVLVGGARVAGLDWLF